MIPLTMLSRSKGYRNLAGYLPDMTLVLLVLAMLTVICAKARLSCATKESNQTPPFPIPLTVPEVRRLLGRLLFPLSRSATAVLSEAVSPFHRIILYCKGCNKF